MAFKQLNPLRNFMFPLYNFVKQLLHRESTKNLQRKNICQNAIIIIIKNQR